MSTLETILTILAPIVSAIVGWLFGRRKDNAQATQSEMENVEKALAIYRGIITDLTKKVQELEQRVSEILHKLDVAEEENRKLKRNENH